MIPSIRIGTRESELALWQANLVKDLLAERGQPSELILVKSEGDIDLETPLYEMGVQGIFTRSLDVALLNKKIDIAVHSMKDVPTRLPAGVIQAAVLERGNYRDLFVINESNEATSQPIATGFDIASFHKSLVTTEDIHLAPVIHSEFTIATSSIRRKAQWLHRYPAHQVVNLRGNVNTRMQKIRESNWQGAILAAAGLERINLKPANAMELDWMLPAPAQGAILLATREGDTEVTQVASQLNHLPTERCTRIEKDFLRGLMGGCSTPISALALIDKKDIFFRGSLLSPDGKQKIEIEKYVSIGNKDFGLEMATEILNNGGQEIADTMRHG